MSAMSLLRDMKHTLRCVWELLFPRFCVVCGRRLDVCERSICSVCCLHLPRTYYSQSAYDNELARLFWGLLPIERASSLFFYHAASETARILYAMKYRQDTHCATDMGRLAAREMVDDGFFEGIDLIVPTPLARRRIRERGYNQSVLIAEGVSRITGIPVCADAVSRDHFRGSQTRLQRWSRNENVKNVFHLTRPERIRGRHVLLIDDVVTTGATLRSLGGELARAGGGVRISILTLGFAKQ